jgi:hypothetical protein
LIGIGVLGYGAWSEQERNRISPPPEGFTTGRRPLEHAPCVPLSCVAMPPEDPKHPRLWTWKIVSVKAAAFYPSGYKPRIDHRTGGRVARTALDS